MKKPYVKPQVYFENFQLSASIALGCKLISNLGENVCKVRDPELNVTIFVEEPTCQYTPPGGNDSVCYHPPAGNNVIFTS